MGYLQQIFVRRLVLSRPEFESPMEALFWAESKDDNRPGLSENDGYMNV